MLLKSGIISICINSFLNLVKFAKSLEEQVVRQQQEISNLKAIINGLRSSLQLSDAQNLALQVLLKKMAKCEVNPSLERQSHKHLGPEFLPCN